MGLSVSFPLPPRIAKELPIRNSQELRIGKLPIPLPIFDYFELITLYPAQIWSQQTSSKLQLSTAKILSSIGLQLAAQLRNRDHFPPLDGQKRAF